MANLGYSSENLEFFLPLQGLKNAKESYGGPAERQFRMTEAKRPKMLYTTIVDTDGVTIAEVEKLLYVRKK
jgi:hypothetical protein